MHWSSSPLEPASETNRQETLSDVTPVAFPVAAAAVVGQPVPGSHAPNLAAAAAGGIDGIGGVPATAELLLVD